MAERGHNYLADLAAKINEEHDAAEQAMKRGLDHALNAGKMLLEAKAAVKHGEWGKWLSENCAFAERTAQLYMRIARNEEKVKSATVADLTLRGAAETLERKAPRSEDDLRREAESLAWQAEFMRLWAEAKPEWRARFRRELYAEAERQGVTPAEVVFPES